VARNCLVLDTIFGNATRLSSQNFRLDCITKAGEQGLTIRELMEEQRKRVRSSDLTERFAAALLIPGVLAERVRELSDFHLGQVLDCEVCSNLSVLAPELTVCMESAERLCRRRTGKFIAVRRPRARLQEGGHLLHAESALYYAGIPHLLLPFQRNKFASNTFMVPSVREANDCLCRARFRQTPRSLSLFIDRQTGRSIRLMEHRTLIRGDFTQ